MLDVDTAHQLRLARKRADLSLRQAARISPSYLSRLERSLSATRMATVIAAWSGGTRPG